MRHILFISCFHEACTIINEALSDLFASAKLSLIIMLTFTMTYLCILYLPEGCVCVSVHLYFSVEKTAYQLEINFRRFSEKNKLRSWWKRRVYECVCNWAPPPSLHDLPIACETVSYSCILPLCVSPRCIYLPTHTRVCILSVSRFDDDNRKLIFRVYHHEVVEFIFLPAYVHNQCAILSLIYE